MALIPPDSPSPHPAVSSLHRLLTGCSNAPSETLISIFGSCARNPTENVLRKTRETGERFCHHYSHPVKDKTNVYTGNTDSAEAMWNLAEKLNYKILEAILSEEAMRFPGRDLSTLLEKDIFHQSLLACCLETVLFASTSPSQIFPWITEVLKLSLLDFYKVIGPVNSLAGLPDSVKEHLRSIEEQILECRAWRRDSALWEILHSQNAKGVPACAEVIMATNLDTALYLNPTSLTLTPESPDVHPPLQEEHRDRRDSCRQVAWPLCELSIQDLYNSPAAGSTRRRHNSHERSSGRRNHITPSITANIGIQGNSTEPSSSQNVNEVELPIMAQITVNSSTTQEMVRAEEEISTSANQPTRTGSLALFFRKVYYLESTRLNDLCQKHTIPENVKGKIWTVFEHSLVHCTDLMKDRHLCQMLLCAVCIMAKMTKEERLYQEIMEHYINHPFAPMHEGHLSLRENDHIGTSQNLELTDSESQSSQTMTHADGVTDAQPQRGDRVTFYETYEEQVKEFAEKIATIPNGRLHMTPPLTPFPIIRYPVSPNVFVSALRRNDKPPSFRTDLTYTFGTSSPNTLVKINTNVNERQQIETHWETPAKRRCLQSRLKEVETQPGTYLQIRLQEVIRDRTKQYL
ncbi:retinoblastoma-like protein 1 isoform X2 [Hyperolius riggenbachi]|uniref:retinoblastoma-like protein 1 isoform X2 n=1 Tax=Hyperolius riggenbachi TaxID=752182 RepID=UPI0035A362FE